MRRALCAVLISSASSMTTEQLHAAPKEPQQASADSVRVAPILPALKLSGSTDGEARFKAAADIVLRLHKDFDVSLAPTAEVATKDGLTNLLSTEKKDTGDTLPWRVGGTVTLFWLGEARARTSVPEFRRADLRAKEAAFERCVAVCVNDLTEGNCKAFTESKKHGASEMDPQDLCDEGRDRWMEHERRIRREQRGIYPPLILSVGLLGGQDSFDYVASASPGASLTRTKNRREGAFRFGTSLAWITGAALPAQTNLTLEGLVVVDSKFESQSRSVEWCTPEGNVQRPDSTDTDPARSCTTKPLGEPERARTMAAAVLVGMLNRFQDSWRFALGPRIARTNDSWAVGFDAPVYFNLISAPAEYTGSYKGIFRVVPSVQFRLKGEDFPDSRFLITLQLLGQRTLFGTALD